MLKPFPTYCKLSLITIFLVVLSCSKNKHDAKPLPQDEAQTPSDGTKIPTDGSEKNDKEKAAPRDESLNNASPQARQFIKNVFDKDGEISGCVEVTSERNEPKADLAIGNFTRSYESSPWKLGTCAKTLILKNGKETAHIGKCVLDPKAKISGSGMSDELVIFVNYYSFQRELDTQSALLNAAYLDDNTAYLSQDEFLCEVLTTSSGDYQRDQEFFNELLGKNLIKEPAE